MDPETRDVQVQVNFASAAPGSQPYEKADQVQIAFIRGEVSLVFHQMDYQQLATALAAANADPTAPLTVVAHTQVVSRVVMTRVTFTQLVAAGAQILSSNPADPA